MDNSVIAIYENGVLRPLTPLPLPEHSQVQVQIRLLTVPPVDMTAHRQRVHEALVAAGLSLPTLGSSPDLTPLSTAQRQDLAKHFSPPTARPLSEIIIEDREGR